MTTSGRAARLLLLLGVLPGCPSLSGINVPGEGGTPHDASADVADVTPRDVGANDVVAESEGSSCTPIAVEPLGPDGGTCALSDGSTCAPGSIAGLSTPWIPPRPHQAKCTAKQVREIATACYGPTASSATCGAFTGSSVANAACQTCIQSESTDSAYSAVILYPTSAEINEDGCIALLDPCNQPCAAAMLAASECTTSACGPGCPASTGAASVAALEACRENAADCPCGAYTVVANACEGALRSGESPAAECLSTDFTTLFTVVGTAFCGTGD